MPSLGGVSRPERRAFALGLETPLSAHLASGRSGSRMLELDERHPYCNHEFSALISCDILQELGRSELSDGDRSTHPVEGLSSSAIA